MWMMRDVEASNREYGQSSIEFHAVHHFSSKGLHAPAITCCLSISVQGDYWTLIGQDPSVFQIPIGYIS
jgi:hypothetical protein